MSEDREGIQRPIDYARPSTPRLSTKPPLSHLAVVALVLSLMAFPCISDLFLRPFKNLFGGDIFVYIVVFPVLVFGLSVWAWFRIWSEPQIRRGLLPAGIAIAICSLWLIFLIIVAVVTLSPSGRHHGP